VNLGSGGITVYEIDENEACEKAKLRNIILLKPAINLMGCSTSSDVLFFLDSHINQGVNQCFQTTDI
jgi:hypothetical protein